MVESLTTKAVRMYSCSQTPMKASGMARHSFQGLVRGADFGHVGDVREKQGGMFGKNHGGNWKDPRMTELEPVLTQRHKLIREIKDLREREIYQRSVGSGAGADLHRLLWSSTSLSDDLLSHGVIVRDEVFERPTSRSLSSTGTPLDSAFSCERSISPMLSVTADGDMSNENDVATSKDDSKLENSDASTVGNSDSNVGSGAESTLTLPDLASSIAAREEEFARLLHGKSQLEEKKILAEMYRSRRRQFERRTQDDVVDLKISMNSCVPGVSVKSKFAKAAQEDEYSDFGTRRCSNSPDLLLFVRDQLVKCEKTQRVLKQERYAGLSAQLKAAQYQQQAAQEQEQEQLRSLERKISSLSQASRLNEQNLEQLRSLEHKVSSLSMAFGTAMKHSKTSRRDKRLSSYDGTMTGYGSKRSSDVGDDRRSTKFFHPSLDNDDLTNVAGVAQRLEEFVLDSINSLDNNYADAVKQAVEEEGQDPLMVECIECRRWVVATVHKGDLAVGYCCESILVSKANN